MIHSVNQSFLIEEISYHFVQNHNCIQKYIKIIIKILTALATKSGKQTNKLILAQLIVQYITMG